MLTIEVTPTRPSSKYAHVFYQPNKRTAEEDRVVQIYAEAHNFIFKDQEESADFRSLGIAFY